MANERIIFEVEFDNNDAKKRIIELEAELVSLKEQQAELTKAYKAGLISLEDYSAQLINLKDAQKEAKDEQKDLQKQLELTAQANTSNANSYNKITAELALAQKELKALGETLVLNEDGTLQLNEAYEEQFKKVKKLKDAQLQFDAAINDGRTNVGNYQRSLEEALKNTNLFGINIGKVGEALGGAFKNGAKIAGDALNGLYRIIIANPITAILAGLAIVLNLLIGTFLSTEKGANQLAQVFARFEPIIKGIKSVLAGVGEALFAVVDGISKAFTFISDKVLGTSLERGAELTKQLQDVEKQLIKVNAQDKAARAEAEKLKSIRDDESKSFKERIASNDKLGKVERDRLKNILDAEKQKLDILIEQNNRLPANLRTTEQLQVIEEQRSKIAEIQEDFYGRITEQITNQVSLLRDSLQLQTEIQSAELERSILQGKIQEGSAQELNERKKLIQQNLDAQLLLFDKEKNLAKLTREERLKQLSETNEQAKLLITQAQVEELQLNKDFYDEQASKAKEYFEKVKEEREKALEKEKENRLKELNERVATAQLRLLNTKEGTQAELEARLNLIREQGALEIEQSDLVGSALLVKQKEIYNSLLEATKQFNDARKAELDEISELTKASLEEDAKANLDVISNEIAVQEYLRKKKEFEATKDIEREVDKNAKLLQLQVENFEATRELEIEQANETLEYELAFEANSDAEKEAAKIRHADALLEIEKRYTEGSIELTNRLKQADLERFKSLESILGNAAQLFEENTIAYKVLATGQAVVSTYLAATNALATVQPYPLNIVAAAILTAQGLLNVAKINQVKFADGGVLRFGGAFANGGKMGVFGGKSHSLGGTKGYFEDGTQIEVEKGEVFAVVNKKDSASLMGLSAINSRHGRSYFDGGGVIGNDIAKLGSEIISFNEANFRQIEASRNQPNIFVRVTDIIDGINSVNTTNSIADI